MQNRPYELFEAIDESNKPYELFEAIDESNKIVMKLERDHHFFENIDIATNVALLLISPDFSGLHNHDHYWSWNVNIENRAEDYNLQELYALSCEIDPLEGEIQEAIEASEPIRNEILIVVEKYYKALQSAKEEMTKIIITHENMLAEASNKIACLLQEGTDPNIPEEISLEEKTVGYSSKKQTVKVYPLHKAVDDKVVSLLLKHGANPNVAGYAGYQRKREARFDYYVGNDNITPIEGACLKHDYKKMMAFLSATPCLLDIDLVDKCLRHLIGEVNTLYRREYTPYDTHIPKNRAARIKYIDSEYLPELNLLKELSKRASTKLLVEQLEFELSYQERAFNQPDSQSKYSWYSLISDKINIYSYYLNQRLSLPIWLVLAAGNTQEKNELSVLPRELIPLIVSMLFHVDLYEQAIEKMNALRFEAFKKSYFMLVENDYLHKPNFSNYLNTEQCLKSYNSRIREQIGSEFGCINEKALITTTAWTLANKHYHNFFSQNNDFIEIAANKSKIDAFEIIHAVMAGYDQAPTNVRETYDHVYSRQQYISCLESTVERNRDKLTIKAWELALAHHENFSSENTVLVDEIVQWAIENSKMYNALSATLYQLTLFESIRNNHHASIRDDIVKHLSELVTRKAESKFKCI